MDLYAGASILNAGCLRLPHKYCMDIVVQHHLLEKVSQRFARVFPVLPE
jgi:hypothetical protein